MSGTRNRSGPDDRDIGSWANETLPLSVRKELLERELSKLGIRKRGSEGSSSHGTAQQQQQPQNEHPQADGESGGHSE
jgi:hypothetical protein